MMSRVKSFDKTFLCTIFRPLLSDQRLLVESKINLPIRTVEEGERMVTSSKIGENLGVLVTRTHFRSLGYGKCPKEVMDAVLDLFQARDDRICSAYKDNHDGERDFEPRRKTLYVKSDFIKGLMNSSSESLDLSEFFPGIPETK